MVLTNQLRRRRSSDMPLTLLHFRNRQGISDIRNRGFARYEEVQDAALKLRSTIVLLDLWKSAAQEMLQPAEIELKCVRHEFGRLLNRLPLELLAETIRFACCQWDSYSDVGDLINMSHVNRRFRNVVLGMTDAWAHVSSNMPTKIQRLSLERSRNASLHVELEQLHNDHEFEEFFANPESAGFGRSRMGNCVVETARCCARWQDIQIRMPKSEHNQFTPESHALYWALSTKFFRDLHVPRLASLSLSHWGYLLDARHVEGNTRAEIIDTIHFYHSWKAPNLRSISFSGIVPAPIPGAAIKELSLQLLQDVNMHYMDFAVAIQDLLVFLQETPSLEKLKVHSHSRGLVDFPPIHNFPTTILKNLRSLTLILDHSANSERFDASFTSLTDCLHIPNLSSLCVKMKLQTQADAVSTDQDVTNLINSFVPKHGFVSLENLFLYVYDDDPNGMRSMSVALDKYPSLRTLTVGITGNLVVTPHSTLHPDLKGRGSLSQITLLACRRGAKDFLAWAASELLDGGNLKNLKKVVVKKCASVTENELSRMFSPHKVEYIWQTPEDDTLYIFDISIGYEFYRDAYEVDSEELGRP